MSTLPNCVEWPAGFEQMLSVVVNPGSRPRDLDQLAALAGDSAHHSYKLRAMCDTEFALRDIANPDVLVGTIDLEKALREAYPGATYRHLGRCYRVQRWRTDSYQRSILLKRVKHAEPTQPMLTSYASVSVDQRELLDGHLLAGDRGMIAEMILSITDAVEGYAIGGTSFPYRDLVKSDKHMTRRQREFSTTGVLLQISEPWFAGESDQAQKNRIAVADALSTILAHEHNLAPANVRSVHKRVSLCSVSGGRAIQDAIVIFDNVQGGLRLTSPLFTDFRSLVNRLERAAELAGTDAMLSEAAAGRLAEWHESLSTSDEMATPPPGNGENIVVLAPGTRVAALVRGSTVERTIAEPQFLEVNGTDVLMYRCEAEQGASMWIAHDKVDPVGEEWRRALWHPQTNVIEELAA